MASEPKVVYVLLNVGSTFRKQNNLSGIRINLSMEQLTSFRKFYADLVLANANVSTENQRLLDGFNSIPRESFLGPGPWHIFTANGYIKTPGAHPEFLYQDILVALDPENNINNGQPSLHARCIDALDISEGEHVAHIGAGTGYYSAILGHMAGASGEVIAYELDQEIADKARENLALYQNIELKAESGVDEEFPEVDVIYVNAGVTHPANSWLDKLRIGGRILFPLTADNHSGAMVLLLKKSSDCFAFNFIQRAMFIPCTGLRDTKIGFQLSEAFVNGSLVNVKSLRRNSEPDETSCFVAGKWWLSSALTT